MANESTFNDISSYVNVVWEAALRYARTNFQAAQLVQVFNNLQGWETRQVTEYEETPVQDNVGELQSLDDTRQVLTRFLRATVSPKEIGKQYYLSDRRLATDTENALADASEAIGYTIGKKVEADVLANLSELSGGEVGASDANLKLADVFKARALLERRNIMASGRYFCVIDPLQYYQIRQELTDIAQPADLNVREEASSSYYVSRIADVQFYVSPNIPFTAVTEEEQEVRITGSPTGGTFTLSYYGIETDPIAYNTTAAAMQAALEALPTIGAGNVGVALGTGIYTVTFTGALAGRPGPLLELGTNNLTGGTSPSVTVSQSVAPDGYSTGGVFLRQAIAFDVRRAMRLEAERKPDLRAWVLNASMWYGTAPWRSDYGVRLIGKSAI